MLCKPIEPKRNILSADQLSNFDSFEKLVNFSSDPTSRYNRTLLNKITSNLNKIIISVPLTDYPILKDRIGQSAITQVEYANYMNDYMYDEQEMAIFTSVYIGATTTDGLEDILGNLNYFFNKNAAGAIAGGFCSAFGNPFSKLAELITLASAGAFVLDNLKNFDSKSILGPIFAIKDKILSIIDNLARSLVSQIETMVGNVVYTIRNLKSNGPQIFKILNKKAQETKEFYNDSNMTSLKDKVVDVITKMAGQFEKLTPAIIAFLLFRLCQLTETIQNLMQNPVDAFKVIVDNMIERTKGILVQSAMSSQLVINNGGVYVNTSDRESIRRMAANEINSNNYSSQPPSSSAGGQGYIGGGLNVQPGSFVTLPMSDAEMNWVQSLTSAGDNRIKFNPQVIAMGSTATKNYNSILRGPYSADENFPDAGWKMIVMTNPFIFAALARVSEKMGKTLYFNSCFRSPFYNWYLREIQHSRGVAVNSYHTKAMATDVSTSNMSNDEVALFIKAASEEGFNRMSVYDSFVHVDIAAGSYRGNWTNNYRGNSNIQGAMRLHLNDSFRKG